MLSSARARQECATRDGARAIAPGRHPMRRRVMGLALSLVFVLTGGFVAQTAAQVPKSGGQVVFGLPWQPVVLNPVVESDGVSYLVNLWLYDSLIRIDR